MGTHQCVVGWYAVTQATKPRRTKAHPGMKNQFHYSFWNWVGFVFCVPTQMRVPRPH
jgi:hypothetical protein